MTLYSEFLKFVASIHILFSIIAALAILAGLVSCFFGYRAFKFILGFIGYLCGGVLVSAIAYFVSKDGTIALVAGMIGGLLCAVLNILLYYVNLFVLGSSIGGTLCAALLSPVIGAFSDSSIELSILYASLAVITIVAVASGIFAIKLQKLAIIIVTGFLGSLSICLGTAHFLLPGFASSNISAVSTTISSGFYLGLLCWIALGIIGILAQYKLFGFKEMQSIPPALPDDTQVYKNIPESIAQTVNYSNN